ncbi:hypothetical protein CPB85DRAFT_1469466, partial [Mucidula mucida]
PASHTQKTARKQRKVFSVKLSHSHAQKANIHLIINTSTLRMPLSKRWARWPGCGRCSWRNTSSTTRKWWRTGATDSCVTVFAGLFSAVVTTFLVQTAQSLQVNMSMVTASIMDEMLHMQRTFFLNEPIEDVTRSALGINSVASPSLTDRCVNGMWFTSLAVSLTTALLAVLTKQWIHQYMTVPSGTPRGRSRSDSTGLTV